MNKGGGNQVGRKFRRKRSLFHFEIFASQIKSSKLGTQQNTYIGGFIELASLQTIVKRFKRKIFFRGRYHLIIRVI